ncbi:flocculation protein FLO11-like isoform X1 [Notolabrus celidotus]|uniref:flocculation protein FLO11-like isoform X1 n=1 Tax=Notolabrus celidotus TaxID=1203425 RepID=UPI00148F953F|nr:flocculation protein FLO11-like isoform X1 [Notolabrus celidotus]
MSEQRQVLTSSPLERETETMDEYSNNVVSELLELTAANLSEQKLYIHSWETGERKTPEDDEDYYLADDLTQQDKERIKKFFNMRRVFAEHLGEVAEIKETITPCNPSTESTTAENTGDKSFFKKVKTAWKKCFSTKSKEEGVRTAEDEREELDSTSERAEEETKAEEELRSFPSQSSTCPIPSPNQVDEGIQLESQRAKEETSTSDQAGSSSQTSDRCSPVTEEVKLLIPQTVQDSVEILQCPESVSALNNTDSDNKNKKPARKSLFKRAQMTWKAGFGKKTSKKINRDEGSHKQDPDSSSLEGAKEEEELSLCLMPSPEEIDEVTPSEIQPTDESPKDLQEEPFSPWNRIIHVYKCEEEHLEIEAGGQPTESPLDSETLLKEEIRSLPPTATSSSAELSLCLMPSPKEMDEVTPSEIQPTDESPKDLQEEPFSPWNRIVQVLPYKCEEEHLEIEAGGQPTESPLDSETLLKEEIRSPTATSSSADSPVTEEAKLLVLQVAEDSMKILQCPESVSALNNTDSDNKTKKPARKSLCKRAKMTWRACFGKKMMVEVTPSEIQPTDESPKDLQETLEEEEVSKDKSPTPERSPGKEEEPAVASENQQLVFESSEISAILERFFQSLSEEQWREVSEGVYNEGVKELLVVLCIDVLIFITDSVIKIVYQSIHQSSTTSDVLTLKSQTSSTRLTENFNDKIQGSFEKSFSQALHDVVGVDTHVRISSEFSQAIAGDVVREVTSALHTLIQAPLDEDFTGTPVPASCRVPKDKAGRKTLAGVIATMRSFLTGRVTSIKRKVLTKCSTEESKEKPTVQTWANQWERCFSASHRGRVHPFTSPDLDAADTSARAELSGATTDLPPSKMKYIPLEIVDISEDEEMTHQDHPSVISPVFVTKPIPQDHLVLEDPDKTDDEKSPTKSQISDSGVSEITASVSDSESKKKKKKSFWSFLCCIFRKNEDKKKNKDNNGQEKPKRCCCCCCCWMRLLCCCCTENEPP